MAQGQKTFSSSGHEVKRMATFQPLPPKEYEFKINAKDMEVKVKEGPGNLPYINGPLEALGTGGDSGKNRRVYHRLFLDLTPSKKDGISMVDRGAGIVALARAAGSELDDVTILQKQKRLDDGSLEDHDILNPKDVLRFLQSIDGTVISGKVKVVPADGNYGPKNEIEYFIETEGVEAAADDDEDEDEADGEADDTDEDEDDEPVPAPKKKVLAKKTRR